VRNFDEHTWGSSLSVIMVADRTSQRLLGAYAVAPLASEWIHQAAQAIRVHIPLDVLLD